MQDLSYRIHINREDFGFSAAQFLVVDGVLEPLSGHNYQIAVELEAPLNDDGVIIDFRTLKRVLRIIVHELNHRTLVPTKNPNVHVSKQRRNLEVRVGRDHFVLPRKHCVLLEIENTSCECLARHIAGRILGELNMKFPGGELRVSLSESPGQAASVTVRL